MTVPSTFKEFWGKRNKIFLNFIYFYFYGSDGNFLSSVVAEGQDSEAGANSLKSIFNKKKTFLFQIFFWFVQMALTQILGEKNGLLFVYWRNTK